MDKLYDFQLKNISGQSVDWNDFKGKKILLVNTASACGFTPQFGALENLYQNTDRSKFEIIGVPSNDFGGQDPGSNEEILAYCQKNFGVSFPMMEKAVVLGPNAHPIFNWLRESLKTEITWNFQKFLIDEEGVAVHTLAPGNLPISPEVIDWIENEKS
ncbi:MAG: glutathione peroxidase [Bacteroidetes bacterium]|nr:glutathione peroxidase [Bacteroidota bacterium]